MKRVTKKQRRPQARKATAKHLFWTSFQHAWDKERANKVRAEEKVVVAMSPTPGKKVKVGPFPQAEKLCFNIVPGEKETSWKEIKGEKKWTELHFRLLQKRSWYWRKGNKKKDGSFGLKKQKSNGVIDTYLSLPKWWTKVLAGELEIGKDAEETKMKLKAIAFLVAKKYAERSGYEFLYCAAHPDSEENFQIHIGLATINKENELVGDSADGVRGRKGLRHIDDCFLSIWRMSKFVRLGEKVTSLPRKAFKDAKGSFDCTKESDCGKLDDVAGAILMEELLRKKFSELVEKVEEVGKSQSEEWKKYIDQRKSYSQLKRENELRIDQVRKLNTKVTALEKELRKVG